MKYISQLSTIEAPTMQAKQKAPKRIIFCGCARCVIPKTTEVKSEKSNTALKWLSIGYSLGFLPFASEYASTAAMMFSRPPTTRNFEP
jgi:hypothetical protein